MIKNYKVKVCGITEEKNYFDLSKYPIDYYGFIFYKKSPRYILNNPDHFFIKNIKNKVAVFVNEDIDTVIRILEKYNFSYIQLHGDENFDYCMKLKKKGIKIIKSYLLNKDDCILDKTLINSLSDLFLFDYKSQKYGGSGKSFDWNLLNNIKIDKPFFLSGGISLDNINNINNIINKKFLYGFDLNSKFEDSPGIKDISLIDKFFNLDL